MTSLSTSDAAANRSAALKRLRELKTLREHDPDNPALLADILRSTYALGQFEEVIQLSPDVERVGVTTSEVMNLRGLSYLWLRRYDEAIAAFETILARNEQDLEVRYNLAIACANTGNFADALRYLDETVLRRVPAAPGLAIRCLHHLGRLEEALKLGQGNLPHLADPGTAAALALVVLDLGQWKDLDALLAQMGDHPDGFMIRGLVALHESREKDAHVALKEAAARQPENGRVVLGLGLCELLRGQPRKAAVTLETAACLMPTHLGSWVASAWAFILAEDLESAERCVARALQLEPRFSEAQGTSAVIAVYRGQLSNGKRLAERALKLDPKCFSGAFARILILDLEGKPAAARSLKKLTLDTRIGSGDQSISDAITSFGLERRTAHRSDAH